MSLTERWQWINPKEKRLSLKRQCEVLALARSSWYYRPVPLSPEDVILMNVIDEQYTKWPFYGSRRMVASMRHLGYAVNRKRVQRLMHEMGIQGVSPGPNTSRRHMEHVIYPYLLRGLMIESPNHVWSADITYIRLLKGFAYLVAIMDWFSRYVLSFRLSNSLETVFCREALDEALDIGTPDIFNTDQGCQFTSADFTGHLQKRKIKISMDGRGRAFDNIFVERLWRSVKYEDIYLKGYQTMTEAQEGLKRYFQFYNNERFHQSLGYRTPREVYVEKRGWRGVSICPR